MLAMCQLQLGLLDEAEESTRKALEAFGPRERAQHLLASIALQRDRPAEAVALLESVGGLDMSNPNGLLLLARSYVELRRWDEAAEAAKRSIALDADNPQPYLALTRQLLHRKLYAEAAEAALSAISLDFARPNAQVVESQWAMLARQGKPPGLDKQRMAAALDQHSRHIRQTLAASSRVELLEVSYPELVESPQPLIDELAKFLGGGFTPGPAVLSCIRPQLHRQRNS
jgi:tetratricopeptide (TPR) repeat protein